jgi:propanol-preferring alcohol dehydrogenase
MVATAAHAYRVPDALDDVEAAPLFCPGVTAYNAVSKAAPRPGSTLAVFGVGGVGHMVVQFAVLAGAEVYAVARSAEHLDLADELGARPVDASHGGPAAALATVGGVDAAIVFAPWTRPYARPSPRSSPAAPWYSGCTRTSASCPSTPRSVWWAR